MVIPFCTISKTTFVQTVLAKKRKMSSGFLNEKSAFIRGIARLYQMFVLLMFFSDNTNEELYSKKL